MGAWFSSLSCSVHQCLLPYEGSSHWYIAGTLRFQWIIFSSRLSHSPARILPLRETSISPGLVTGKLKVVHHFSIMFNSILSRLYVKSPCSCQGIVMLHPGKTHCTARRPSLTYAASVWRSPQSLLSEVSLTGNSSCQITMSNKLNTTTTSDSGYASTSACKTKSDKSNPHGLEAAG